MTEIRISEELCQGDQEAVLTTWYFDDGDYVEAGDIVAEVMLQKIQLEVEAPENGILRKKVGEEQPVHQGLVIGTIE